METARVASKSSAEILSQLTLEEKVSLLSGMTTWRTQSIPRVDIKSIKLTDGPNGARGESIYNSTKATCFPCGASLGASWDHDLVKAVGAEIAKETKTKRAQVVLGPTMNIHRSPLHGRSFESFSEDPVLTGHLAAAYINGVQSEGVAASPKHFVANEVEKNRTSVDTIVHSKPLREIYLRAFQIMLQHSDPWTLMTSYNKLNGKWCSDDKDLLQGVVRQEWGYQGMLVSDWFGTYSTIPAIKSGLNLEMPGPSKHRGRQVVEAVKEGLLSETDIDHCALPVIELAQKLDPETDMDDEAYEPTPERIAIARRAATESIVLLKNHNAALPIRPKMLKKNKVAIIGILAEQPVPHGGGSASVRSKKVIAPLNAIRDALSDTDVTFNPGVPVFRKLPSPKTAQMKTTPESDSPHGVQVEWFDGRSMEPSKLLQTDTIEEFNLVLIDAKIKGLKPEFCARLSTYLTPTSTGEHVFGLTSSGPSTLFINGKSYLHFQGMNTINEDFIWQPSKYEQQVRISLEAGRHYHMVLEAQGAYSPIPPGMSISPQGIRVGYFEEVLLQDGITQAVKAAEEADVAIVFTGTTSEWESEGFDRETIALSKGQDSLVSAVSAAQPRTIVVNQSGAPVSMPWIDSVAAVLQTFFGGEEVGNAVSDILMGTVNPSGKLPTTFLHRIEDTPSYGNFPGTDPAAGNCISYAEGVLVGYRHFSAHKVEPLFPFAHGLSYTTFNLGSVRLDAQSETDNDFKVELSTTLTNTGSIAGSETVQLYLLTPHEVPFASTTAENSPYQSSLKSVDVRVLKEFSKLRDLAPGEERSLHFTLNRDSFAEWDEKEGMWATRPREYEIVIATSLVGEGKTVKVKLGRDRRWRGLR